MTVSIGVDFHALQQTISYLTTEAERYNGCNWSMGSRKQVRSSTVSLPANLGPGFRSAFCENSERLDQW
jgi:hypothetical protein